MKHRGDSSAKERPQNDRGMSVSSKWKNSPSQRRAVECVVKPKKPGGSRHPAHDQNEYCAPNWINRAGFTVLLICPNVGDPIETTEGCRNDGWLNALKASTRRSRVWRS